MREGLPEVVLVEEPPKFEFKNGLFYVTCERSGIHRAYRPSTYFQTIANMVAESRKYRIASAEVVQLHAASASGSPSK